MSVLLPAKDIPVYRVFRNPFDGQFFRKLAYDRKEQKVLAVDGQGGYWECLGDYLVELCEGGNVQEVSKLPGSGGGGDDR